MNLNELHVPEGMWIVAVHKYWPDGQATTQAQQHVGPYATETEAREYAECLERPMVGYVYRLISG